MGVGVRGGRGRGVSEGWDTQITSHQRMYRTFYGGSTKLLSNEGCLEDDTSG